MQQVIAGRINRYWTVQPPPKRGRPASDQSHPWLAIHDPSGDFQGRRFRLVDLICSEWPDGMIFWNILGGEVRIWRGGQFQTFSARKRRGRAAHPVRQERGKTFRASKKGRKA